MERVSWRILLSTVPNTGSFAKMKESSKELGFRELWSSGTMTLVYCKCVCLLCSQWATSFLAPKTKKKKKKPHKMLGQEASSSGDSEGPASWWLPHCGSHRQKLAPLSYSQQGCCLIGCCSIQTWAEGETRATNTSTQPSNPQRQGIPQVLRTQTLHNWTEQPMRIWPGNRHYGDEGTHSLWRSPNIWTIQ